MSIEADMRKLPELLQHEARCRAMPVGEFHGVSMAPGVRPISYRLEMTIEHGRCDCARRTILDEIARLQALEGVGR